MIEASWGHTLDELHTYLRDGNVNDPAFVAALRIRGALEVDGSDITNNRERVHRFTRQAVSRCSTT